MSERQHNDESPAGGPIQVPSVPSSVPWGVLQALAVLAGFVVLQGAVGTLVGMVGFRGLLRDLLGATGGHLTALALVFVLIKFWSPPGSPWLPAIGFRRPSWQGALRAWKPLAEGAGAYIGVTVALAAVWHSLGLQWDEVPAQPLTRMIGTEESRSVLALACVVAVVVAPLAEEVIFRAVVYLPLRARLGVVPAALIVSVIFSTAHVYPWGAAHLLVLSLTFVALFERTGTLWAPIVAHGLYNGLSIVLIRLLPLWG